MAKIPGLQLKGRTYYLRVRVPKGLQPHFKTKEIIRSLETTDYSVAAKRILTARMGIEAEFEKKRQQIKAAAENTDTLSGYTDHELTTLTLKWLGETKSKQEKHRVADTETLTEEQKRDYAIELQREELMARQEKLGVSDEEMHDGMTTARLFLEAEGITYSRTSDNFRRLGHFFSKAIHELAQQQLREWQGKLHIPSDSVFSTHAHNGYTPPGKKIKMGDLVKQYTSDPKRALSETALKNYRIISRAIKEMIGNETFAHEVTREQCRAIGDLLFELPANATKKIKFKTLEEAVKIGKQKNLPKISASTHGTYMQKLDTIMQYAVREMYIQSNPAKKLGVESAVKSKDKRDPFKLEQLQAIFGSDIYHKNREQALLYNPKTKNKAVYTRYWIPLIALWTGMRMNEICQLHVSDVMVVDGVPVISVRETSGDDDDVVTGKKVKTENAIRIVPVHPMLSKAGFLDYVESVKKAGEVRIFPNLKLNSRGYYSHEFSKWFSLFLKDIKAKTKKTSFHSFRHTYRDAIRKAKLPRDAGLQLGGWSSGATDDDYGGGLDPKDLYEEIQKIKYDGLDLTHLYVDG